MRKWIPNLFSKYRLPLWAGRVADREATAKAVNAEKQLEKDRIKKDHIQCDEHGKPYKVQITKYIGA